MGKCTANNYSQKEITLCDTCFHKYVCGDRDYLSENQCCDFVEAPTIEPPVKRAEALGSNRTNGDLIRKMSNEQLARVLECPNIISSAAVECEEQYDKGCTKCILDWLNQEVEEET